MIAGIRRRLTYANVMATIAVFLALGLGTAWALEKNSVESQHIVNGQVKGVDVDESTLKGVTDDCPKQMTMYAESFCLDDEARADGAGKSWFEAVGLCADNGLRLPTVGELEYADHYGFFTIDNPNAWTDSVYDTDDGDVNVDGALAFDRLYGEFTEDLEFGRQHVICAASASDKF